eukprot:1668736-Rhodomonas_salina.1
MHCQYRASHSTICYVSIGPRIARAPLARKITHQRPGSSSLNPRPVTSSSGSNGVVLTSSRMLLLHDINLLFEVLLPGTATLTSLPNIPLISLPTTALTYRDVPK